MGEVGSCRPERDSRRLAIFAEPRFVIGNRFPVVVESGVESGLDRDRLIDEILALEAETRAVEARLDVHRKRRGRARALGRKLFLYATLGRRLTIDLGRLIVAVREGREPLFGREMARTLDSASRKLVGYKRWVVLFGLLAALPGSVSVYLLWQQNQVVAVEKENAIADSGNTERGRLLTLIYSTYDKSPTGLTTTPIHSAMNRRRAVLRLIERDREFLIRTQEDDHLGLNRMVDLSNAPLRDVDFSAIPGEPKAEFTKVGFVGSNFENASFAGCKLDHVWFSGAALWYTDFRDAVCRDTSFDDAYLIGVDFRGAELTGCEFAGASYDKTTRWPEGFDPDAAGAKLFEGAEAP